jgi:hypothetical protein
MDINRRIELEKSNVIKKVKSGDRLKLFPKFKNDRDVIKASFEYSSLNYEDLSEELKGDKEILLLAISKSSSILGFIQSKYLKDEDVLKLSIYQDYHILSKVSEDVLNRLDIAMYTVLHHGVALSYFSNEIKDNKGVVLQAIKSNFFSFAHLSEKSKLRVDRDILEEFEKGLNNHKNENIKTLTWIKNNIELLEKFRESEIMQKKMTTGKKASIKKF